MFNHSKGFAPISMQRLDVSQKKVYPILGKVRWTQEASNFLGYPSDGTPKTGCHSVRFKFVNDTNAEKSPQALPISEESCKTRKVTAPHSFFRKIKSQN